jgi:protein-tyrosine-phosphatase
MRTLQVLFVCTGNTCRSALAEAIARRAADDRGLDVEFASAGVDAVHGQPASEHALSLARERGADLAGHRTQPLTRELVEAHDLVLVMERWQQDVVERLGGAGKTRLLDASRPVEDPVLAGSRAAYERTYDHLEQAIADALDRFPNGAAA